MQTNEIIIEVDQVRSGKVNIISFYRENKLINKPMLKLKAGSERYNYYYRHHLDGDDLVLLSKRLPGIYPYDGRKSTNDWADEMKREFKRLIVNGDFDKRLEKDEVVYDIRFVWVNN
ncbi:hypothetical protein H1D32_24320 [Anaerobacillus sp. CMMVII]|uniref:hypothetical protein n=1 Tax=Anaerobacillus sp. CMMVII TaxID=2755588 RepID=UPI0021B78138|nr:hypothetical protein [Anaerobacillus sp. CMMVII]MCT8140522.1 hypothetical protein [Anaerobacillus sp. CMMVII]